MKKRLFRAHLAAFARCGFVILLPIFIAVASAQDLDKDKPVIPANQPQRVIVAPVEPVPVRAGGSAHVELSFRVVPGFHINSNKPNSDLLVPTTIKLNPPTDIAIGKVTYPAGRNLSFPFAPNEKLNVYTGDFSITALVQAARAMPPGRFRVHGELKYQACDNRLCYPPALVPVAFDVKISKARGTGRTRRNPRQSPHVHP